MTTRLDDGALVRRSCDSPRAFAPLYDRHAPAVHRYLARRAGQQTADDLLGEVFTVAFAGRHQYDPACRHAGPWLYGIARNVLLSEFRRRTRERGAVDRAAGRDIPPGTARSRLHRARAQLRAALSAHAPCTGGAELPEGHSRPAMNSTCCAPPRRWSLTRIPLCWRQDSLSSLRGSA